MKASIVLSLVLASALVSACGESIPLTSAPSAVPSPLSAVGGGGVSSPLGYGTGTVNSCPHDAIQGVTVNTHDRMATVFFDPLANLVGYVVTIERGTGDPFKADAGRTMTFVTTRAPYFKVDVGEHTHFRLNMRGKTTCVDPKTGQNELGTPSAWVEFTTQDPPEPEPVDLGWCPWWFEA